MHVVVNHFALEDTAGWSKIEAAVEQFQTELSWARPEFLGVSLVREGENKAIFLVLFQDLDSLNDISRSIAAPWFTEHVKPYIAGAVDRHVGEIVAGRME